VTGLGAVLAAPLVAQMQRSDNKRANQSAGLRRIQSLPWCSVESLRERLRELGVESAALGFKAKLVARDARRRSPLQKAAVDA
jgi:hypothetical protein